MTQVLESAKRRNKRVFSSFLTVHSRCAFVQNQLEGCSTSLDRQPRNNLWSYCRSAWCRMYV